MVLLANLSLSPWAISAPCVWGQRLCMRVGGLKDAPDDVLCLSSRNLSAIHPCSPSLSGLVSLLTRLKCALLPPLPCRTYHRMRLVRSRVWRRYDGHIHVVLGREAMDGGEREGLCSQVEMMSTGRGEGAGPRKRSERETLQSSECTRTRTEK